VCVPPASPRGSRSSCIDHQPSLRITYALPPHRRARSKENDLPSVSTRLASAQARIALPQRPPASSPAKLLAGPLRLGLTPARHTQQFSAPRPQRPRVAGQQDSMRDTIPDLSPGMPARRTHDRHSRRTACPARPHSDRRQPPAFLPCSRTSGPTRAAGHLHKRARYPPTPDEIERQLAAHHSRGQLCRAARPSGLATQSPEPAWPPAEEAGLWPHDQCDRPGRMMTGAFVTRRRQFEPRRNLPGRVVPGVFI